MLQNQNGYSEKDVLNMQREAINRVNEMQKMVKRNLNNTNNTKNRNIKDLKTIKINKEDNINKNEININKERTEEYKKNNMSSNSLLNQFLNLSSNKDSLLIFSLILILISEKYEDKIVVLALIYIFLDLKN